MNNFLTALQYFLFITLELVVLFILISMIVSLIFMYISEDKLNKWLSKKGLLGNFLASIAGSLTPFCACSTIPMTVGLLNARAPFGSVMSFLIASPLLNPIILSMIMALLGLKAAFLYFSVTFLGSIIFGATLQLLGADKYIKDLSNKRSKGLKNEVAQSTFRQKLKASFKVAVGDFKAIQVYLYIGVGIGAIVYGYIPEAFIMEVAGQDNPFAIPIAAIVGVPLYIRAETAIPIGLSLFQKGMSIGAVMALIIGGAGMAIPEMSMLASIFKKRLVLAITATIFLTAVIAGYMFNFIM